MPPANMLRSLEGYQANRLLRLPTSHFTDGQKQGRVSNWPKVTGFQSGRTMFLSPRVVFLPLILFYLSRLCEGFQSPLQARSCPGNVSPTKDVQLATAWRRAGAQPPAACQPESQGKHLAGPQSTSVFPGGGEAGPQSQHWAGLHSGVR